MKLLYVVIVVVCLGTFTLAKAVGRNETATHLLCLAILFRTFIREDK